MVWRYISLIPALRQEDLWVQSQPGLHKEFQDSQGYIETLSQKSQEEFIEEPVTLFESSDDATYSW